MSRLRQLESLSSLIRGELPPDVDWMSVLALANQALVTPQLYSAATRTGTVSQMPAEVRTYLHELWRRNRQRNRRLFAQLREAVSVLNAAGLEPTLLKGAAHWAALGRPSDHDRMLGDLDLLVSAEEAACAVSALEAAGFPVDSRYDDVGLHVAAELARPDDVGVIDLHRRPPGPPGLAQAAMTVAGELRTLAWDGVRAKAPSPALQIFLLVLHDQFHEGGYWRGGFVLRHLLDIATLSRRPAGVDWSVLAKLPQTRLVSNAIDAQLLAAESVCGALAPETAHRPWVRLQHARLRAQFGWPNLSPLFAGLGLTSELFNLATHRRLGAADRRAIHGPRPRVRSVNRYSRFVREFLAPPQPGRI